MRKWFVLAVSVAISVFANSQIVKWTFETSVPTTSGPHSPEIGLGAANGSHTDAATAYSNPTGNGSAESFSSNRWSPGDYYQFQFATTGFSNISITWDATGTATGPRDFKVQYSTDGMNFTDAAGVNSVYALTAETWSSVTAQAISTRTLDLGTVTILNDAATVFIRLVAVSATTIGGATPIPATGTSRVDNFTVNGNPIGTPSTDFFRTSVSGNWSSTTTWESSPTAAAGTWVAATAVPTSAANTILIQNGHTVIISSSVSADQLVIENGGILDYTAGTFTIDDGAGPDMIIRNGAVFILSMTNTIPVFSGGTPVVDINGGGILRISASGLTGAGTGVNANNFVYRHQSILEYTLQGGFATSGVTFFPNVDAVTIPVFRVLHNGAPSNVLVGANTATTFNGIFENNGTSDVIWQNSGNKIFRNGIRGTGNIIANGSAATAKFIMNGATAELGGAGSLTVPATGGLEVGPSTIVTMQSSKTVTGDISLLADSKIDLGAFDLTVTGAVNSATISSYVRTSGTGKLKLSNVGAGAGAKLFPIGLSSMNPLLIQSTTTADYSARIVEPITPPIYNENSAVTRTWYLSSSVTAPGATISFGYSYPGDCGPLFINTGPAVQVGVNVSNIWHIHQSGLTPASFAPVPGTFAVTPGLAINTFTANGTEYPFVIANNGAVLPLDNKILATGRKINNTGHINWKIFTTNNIGVFEVQRSVNNNQFVTIATIAPLSQVHQYDFDDLSLGRGANQYRIKAVLPSGTVLYSNTIVISDESEGLLVRSLTPNPVSSVSMLAISAGKTGIAKFYMYDVSGRLVKQFVALLQEGDNMVRMDMEGLSRGSYHLLVQQSENKVVFRVAKQ